MWLNHAKEAKRSPQPFKSLKITTTVRDGEVTLLCSLIHCDSGFSFYSPVALWSDVLPNACHFLHVEWHKFGFSDLHLKDFSQINSCSHLFLMHSFKLMNTSFSNCTSSMKFHHACCREKKKKSLRISTKFFWCIYFLFFRWSWLRPLFTKIRNERKAYKMPICIMSL